jgi:hypothetical protein
MKFLFNNLEPSPVVVLTLGKSRQYTLFDQGMERLGSTSLLAINGCAGFEVAALSPAIKGSWVRSSIFMWANIERSKEVIDLSRSFLIVQLRYVKMYNIVVNTIYDTVANLWYCVAR